MTREKYFHIAQRLYEEAERGQTTLSWQNFGSEMADLYEDYVHWDRLIQVAKEACDGNWLLEERENYIIVCKPDGKRDLYDKERWNMACQQLGQIGCL